SRAGTPMPTPPAGQQACVIAVWICSAYFQVLNCSTWTSTRPGPGTSDSKRFPPSSKRLDSCKDVPEGTSWRFLAYESVPLLLEASPPICSLVSPSSRFIPLRWYRGGEAKELWGLEDGGIGRFYLSWE